MKERFFSALAPSNIALVKYMGKKEGSRNLPENSSLSLTLNSLATLTEISFLTGSTSGEDRWFSESPKSIRLEDYDRFHSPVLGEEEVRRILDHIKRVRQACRDLLPEHGISFNPECTQASWSLRSGNSFPASSGIASSASSFAAVTLATAMACSGNRDSFEKAWNMRPRFREALASVSRMGSGSSCRSFDGPWILWEQEHTKALSTQMPELSHFVVLIQEKPKPVPTSEAHLRVKSSPLWQGRVQRAENRVQEISEALHRGDFSRTAKIAWAESWEMHSLFHTAEYPFTYWEPGTLRLLQELSLWAQSQEGPIVTLDAGPNVHITAKASLAGAWRKRLSLWCPESRILEDRQGRGASPYAWGER